MSILSSIKSVFSTATSAVSASTSLKVYITIGVLAASLAGSAWLYVSGLKSTITTQEGTITTQGKTIAKQESNITTVKADRDEAVSQRDQAQKRTAQLNTENQINASALEAAREKAQTLADKLAQAQLGDMCTKHPVPEPVKRLQQQAIREFNAEYGSEAGNTASKTASGGDVPHS